MDGHRDRGPDGRQDSAARPRRSEAPIRLLAITDRRAYAGPQEHLEALERLAAVGVDAVQIREKDLDDQSLCAFCREARSRLPRATRIFVNGRMDIAVAAGLDGVHLTSGGPPASLLRERFGPTWIFGRSTHTLGEVAEAVHEGLDYVVFGPVYPTASKEGMEPIPGLVGLSQAARHHRIPVLGLGGVTLSRLPALAAMGAAGAAAIRLFQDEGAAAKAVRKARRLWPAPGHGETSPPSTERDR